MACAAFSVTGKGLGVAPSIRVRIDLLLTGMCGLLLRMKEPGCSVLQQARPRTRSAPSDSSRRPRGALPSEDGSKSNLDSRAHRCASVHGMRLRSEHERPSGLRIWTIPCRPAAPCQHGALISYSDGSYYAIILVGPTSWALASVRGSHLSVRAYGTAHMCAGLRTASVSPCSTIALPKVICACVYDAGLPARERSCFACLILLPLQVGLLLWCCRSASAQTLRTRTAQAL